jgi:hypothetical protein
MGERTAFEKAAAYSLSRAEVIVLFNIASWFNGESYTVHGSRRSIATEYEPTLRQMFGDAWSDEFAEAHERLIDRGLCKSRDRGENTYIAGRRCRWAPTKNGMQVIETIFSHSSKIYPEWATDQHARPPTFRDGNELMEHRKGTLAAGHLFGQLERVTATEIYPRVNLPQRPDLRLFRFGEPVGRVEVLTNHNNTETWQKKFDTWRDKNAGVTVWLYENRKGMVQFWNHLIRNGIIELDNGQFGGRPSNWSPKRVNDRLRRSREGRPNYDSHDIVWTIAGVVDATRIRAFRLLEENNIILQS